VLNDAHSRAFSQRIGLVASPIADVKNLLKDEDEDFITPHNGTVLNYLNLDDVVYLLGFVGPVRFSNMKEVMSQSTKHQIDPEERNTFDAWDRASIVPDAMLHSFAAIRSISGFWQLTGSTEEARVKTKGGSLLLATNQRLVDSVHFNGGLDAIYSRISRCARRAVKFSTQLFLLEKACFNH
jgi:hypothetical protein